MLRLVLLITCLSSINAAYFKVISGKSSEYGSSKDDNSKPAECLEQNRTNGNKSNRFGDDIGTQCCKDVDDKVQIVRFFTPKQAKGHPECVVKGKDSTDDKLCCRAVNYDAAKSLCDSRGDSTRLCTFDEANDATIQNNRFDKSGCDFDGHHIWTSTPCEPELSISKRISNLEDKMLKITKCCNERSDYLSINCSMAESDGWTQSCSECGISIDSGGDRIKFQSQYFKAENMYLERVFYLQDIDYVVTGVSYSMTSIRLEKKHGDYIYMNYSCDADKFIEERLVDGVKANTTVDKVLDLSNKTCNVLTIRFGMYAKGGKDDLAWFNCPMKILYNKHDTDIKNLNKKIDDLEHQLINFISFISPKTGIKKSSTVYGISGNARVLSTGEVITEE
jgi:hypothetical protein